ncbi:MAG: HAD family hydrolase [Xanthomonadaceae bacterium]|nr:HAD family hydrolase [Xanthomonadaceae bacterium]MDP2184609.1 HAD family hydrolase [Xanthomonadales bacterium]
MNLALFDFDGTITTHETMPDFVRRSISRRRLLFGQFLLAPLVIGYKLGLVSGLLVRSAIVRFGYTGVPKEEIEAAGRDFANSYLSGALRQEAMQCIAWHKAQGNKVVVVSGGLDVYLAPWCKEHGLELICSSLQHRDGVLTGRYQGRQCVLAEKAQRVRDRYDMSSFNTIYAYGDTPEDQDLLALANKAYYRWQEVGATVGL